MSQPRAEVSRAGIRRARPEALGHPDPSFVTPTPSGYLLIPLGRDAIGFRETSLPQPVTPHAPSALHFESDIVVERSSRDVAEFFDEPSNLAKWDRSVARVEPTSTGHTAVGFTFDTIAPTGLRMSYRITEHEPERQSTIELVSSRMFRTAVWRMRYDPVPGGTRITCAVDFTLRPLYFFLVVPLVMTQRRALARDLSYLKAAIESQPYTVDA